MVRPMKDAPVPNLYHEVISAMELAEVVFRHQYGFGACPVLAAYLHSRIGGKLVVGYYKGGEHVWVEHGRSIYDVNNMDDADNLMLYVRNSDDPRYVADAKVTSKRELRDLLPQYGMMSPEIFDKLYSVVVKAAKKRRRRSHSRRQGFSQ